MNLQQILFKETVDEKYYLQEDRLLKNIATEQMLKDKENIVGMTYQYQKPC